MRQIILSKTGTKYKGIAAFVDDEDYDFLNQFNWYAWKSSQEKFYVHRTTYDINGKQGASKMHRLIMGISDENILVDHRDRNGLNNQKANLRICNKSQNAANRIKNKNCSSTYLGVHYHKGTSKWLVKISKNYKTIHIGYFTDEMEAAQAYNEAAKRLHGDFASLNKI